MINGSISQPFPGGLGTHASRSMKEPTGRHREPARLESQRTPGDGRSEGRPFLLLRCGHPAHPSLLLSRAEITSDESLGPASGGFPGAPSAQLHGERGGPPTARSAALWLPRQPLTLEEPRLARHAQHVHRPTFSVPSLHQHRAESMHDQSAPGLRSLLHPAHR